MTPAEVWTEIVAPPRPEAAPPSTVSLKTWTMLLIGTATVVTMGVPPGGVIVTVRTVAAASALLTQSDSWSKNGRPFESPACAASRVWMTAAAAGEIGTVMGSPLTMPERVRLC